MSKTIPETDHFARAVPQQKIRIDNRGNPIGIRPDALRLRPTDMGYLSGDHWESCGSSDREVLDFLEISYASIPLGCWTSKLAVDQIMAGAKSHSCVIEVRVQNTKRRPTYAGIHGLAKQLKNDVLLAEIADRSCKMVANVKTKAMHLI